jgi:hypothetical protein
MEFNYDKKDLKESPKTKSVKNVLPEGWEMYLKRGTWNVRDALGQLTHWKTEKEAWEHING